MGLLQLLHPVFAELLRQLVAAQGDLGAVVKLAFSQRSDGRVLRPLVDLGRNGRADILLFVAPGFSAIAYCGLVQL
jgi:hypothetical protein